MQLSSSSSNPASKLYAACKTYAAVLDGAKNETLNIKEATDAGWCMGFVRGLVTGLNTNWDICAPEASIGTLVHVFIKFIDEHPRLRDESDALALALAVNSEYPCPKK